MMNTMLVGGDLGASPSEEPHFPLGSGFLHSNSVGQPDHFLEALSQSFLSDINPAVELSEPVDARHDIDTLQDYGAFLPLQSASVSGGSEAEERLSAKRVQKADREKLRRDRLNEQFLELANALDSDRVKHDKATILIESLQVVRELRVEVKRLKMEHTSLLNEARDLTIEKNELREEKEVLRNETDRLQSQLDHYLCTVSPPWMSVMDTPSFSLPFPPLLSLNPTPPLHLYSSSSSSNTLPSSIPGIVGGPMGNASHISISHHHGCLPPPPPPPPRLTNIERPCAQYPFSIQPITSLPLSSVASSVREAHPLFIASMNQGKPRIWSNGLQCQTPPMSNPSALSPSRKQSHGKSLDKGKFSMEFADPFLSLSGSSLLLASENGNIEHDGFQGSLDPDYDAILRPPAA